MPTLYRFSRSHGGSPQPRLSRRGFTLIELIVALVLLDLALLGLVASSAAAARQLADARTRSRAAAAAEARLEWAVSQPCGSAQSGTALLDRGLREGWSVSAPFRNVRLVIDTLEFTSRGTIERQLFVSRVACEG